MQDWHALEREARRLHWRYTTEVVEALGLCPWAAEARQSGRVHTQVSRCAAAELEPTLEMLAEFSQDSTIDIAFVLYPLLDLDRLAFAHFVAALRDADAARHPIGETVFALVEFHPNATFDPTSAERLVPFLRRTPDLTLQVTRRSALSAVRMSQDQGTRFIDVSRLMTEAWAPRQVPLATRVANSNLRTVTRMGIPALRACVEGILADRHASYFALGVPLPLWKAHT